MANFTLIHASDFHFSARYLRHQNFLSDPAALFATTDGSSEQDLGLYALRTFFNGGKVTYPSTFHEGAASAAATYIADRAERVDAIVLTGDLATTGELNDLNAAWGFLCGQPFGAMAKIISSNDKIMGNGPPVCLLPGNHDRFGPDFVRKPGCKRFEEVFGEDWDAGTDLQRASQEHQKIMTFELRKDNSTLYIFCVDFSLESDDEEFGFPQYLGYGNVYEDRYWALVRETLAAKIESPASVIIWAMHFPPGDDIDPKLQLARSKAIAEGARDCKVDLILCGHVHQPLNYPLGEFPFPHVICAGSACSVEYEKDISNHFYEIEIVTGGGGLEEVTLHGVFWDEWGNQDFRRMGHPRKIQV